ncbi:CbrC family protein [Paenibacillus yanchengensis]|uniref:CbrC family protein n=1 Tax=Paenibacillus yanchengensis TaxID=2035833 RepID=A0ABW4YH85_9BACL
MIFAHILGMWGQRNWKRWAPADEVITKYEERDEYADIREYLVKAGSLAGYLFQCLHCQKYHIWVDAD